MPQIENVGTEAIALFIFAFLFIGALTGLVLWYSWWASQKKGTGSPYTKQPMMLGVDLPLSIGKAIDEFLLTLTQPENAPFDLKKAALCRDTGRIFPNCVKRGEIIFIGWDFLEKRYPGRWRSWGSLSETQKSTLRLCHRSLDNFQTEQSCPNQFPKDITPPFLFTKPGPLYVDLATKTLLGWQNVPTLAFEVLVVQKPAFDTLDDTL